MDRDATVDDDGRTRDEGRLVRGEEENGRRDLLGPSHAPERMGGTHRPAELLLPPRREDRRDARVDATGADAVHADVVARVFQSGRPREVDDAGFRGVVRGETEVAEESRDGRRVDDRASFLPA